MICLPFGNVFLSVDYSVLCENGAYMRLGYFGVFKKIFSRPGEICFIYIQIIFGVLLFICTLELSGVQFMVFGEHVFCHNLKYKLYLTYF